MRKYAVRRARENEVTGGLRGTRDHGPLSPYYVVAIGDQPFEEHAFTFHEDLDAAVLFDTIADAATAIRLDGKERGESYSSSCYASLTIVPVEVEVTETRRELEQGAV